MLNEPTLLHMFTCKPIYFVPEGFNPSGIFDQSNPSVTQPLWLSNPTIAVWSCPAAVVW
jgi:hypothetical protein